MNEKNFPPPASALAELNAMHLAALYAVSQVLARGLDCRATLREVLRVLADEASLVRGLVSVVESAAAAAKSAGHSAGNSAGNSAGSGALAVEVMHGGDAAQSASAAEVRYQPGEGILGLLLEKPRTVVVACVEREPRFLNRLGFYAPQLPFIAVPIKVAGAVRGILAVQPEERVRSEADAMLLEERAQFVEIVANLLGQTVSLSLDAAQEKDSLLEERDSLRRTVKHQFGFDSIVGRSAVMRRVFEQARLVAKWNTTVLLRGETGTGKELIANAIHYNSPRAKNALIKLNCAALPENLLESELFGHERGAFTGAVESRKGRFEQAHGGTIFLDEIGEISPAFQAKLLRVLQEGEFERVGGNRTQKVDVRIIAATHRDLETAVEQGDFREDLFYRLNVMPLFLPPLRERIEDIPEIARHLLGKIGKEQRRRLNISDAAMRRLASHPWPGNVRELENCLERAAVLSEDGTIALDAIRFQPVRERPPAARPAEMPPPVAAAIAPARPATPSSGAGEAEPLPQNERERVIAALQQAGWVQAKAARLLGMTPRQIAYRIQTLNIEVRQL